METARADSDAFEILKPPLESPGIPRKIVPPSHLSTLNSDILILPGYGGSGPAHWQTLWEQAHPEFRRVEEGDWDHPDCKEWVASLQSAVHVSGPNTILVAHSLACLQVVHWAIGASPTRLSVRGALLVAVPDPDAAVFPEVARSFGPVPTARLPFPSLVVGSVNDPYATPAFTEACAEAWGSRLQSIGAAGHVNASSGLGRWDAGLKLLEELKAV